MKEHTEALRAFARSEEGQQLLRLMFSAEDADGNCRRADTLDEQGQIEALKALAGMMQ